MSQGRRRNRPGTRSKGSRRRVRISRTAARKTSRGCCYNNRSVRAEARHPPTSRKWRNWQTHQLEGLALAITWGFESPLSHQTSSRLTRACNQRADPTQTTPRSAKAVGRLVHPGARRGHAGWRVLSVVCNGCATEGLCAASFCVASCSPRRWMFRYRLVVPRFECPRILLV